jgi:glycosyltransferase involved in cell wall biosynthesis
LANVPRVSVIIPTYKHQQFVLATLDSVFAQSYGDYEIIVVNDGSPDETHRVLEPLVAARRIKYIQQPNAGQASARNRGLAEAQGEYVAFLDDDDLWPADKLQHQVAALSASIGSVLIYGYPRWFNETTDCPHREPCPSGDVRRQYLRRNWIWSPGQTLIRTSALRQIGGFDPSIQGADDWDMYIRLASVGHFIYENAEALAYRLHRGNASRNIGLMRRNLLRVRSKHLGRLPAPGRFTDWMKCTRYISEHCSLQFLKQADVMLEEGRRWRALAQLTRACTVSPRWIINRGTVRRIVNICSGRLSPA